MKKFKNKILIPIIASLSSIAVVAPLATTVSNTPLTSVLDSSVNAASYVTITYEADYGDTGWTSTIQGPNRVRVRSGHTFGSAQKPTAIHSEGWKFKGWSESDHTAATQTLVKDTDKISTNTILYPVFEQPGIVITGNDTFTAGEEVSFTATFEGATASNYSWDFKDWTGDQSKKPVLTPNGLTAKLTTYFGYNGQGTLTIHDNVSGEDGELLITVKAAYEDSDKIWVEGTTDYKPYWIDMADLCSETNDIKLYTFGTTTVKETITRANFHDMDIYIGSDVLALDDNFGANLTNFNSSVIFETTDTSTRVKIPSKCTYIGQCFMQGCATFNNAFTLPDALKVIGNGFLDGCSVFNQALTIPANVADIGSQFMNECEAFNQNLTLPESINHVGEDFMVNCYAMESTITVNCKANVFDLLSNLSYTLTVDDNTQRAFTQSVKIAGKNASAFADRFENRLTTTPYRKLTVNPVNFQDCEWDDIIYWAEQFENGRKTDEELCDHFLDAGTTIATLDGFVGLERNVTINGLTHVVRCLAVQHKEDKIVENGVVTDKKATFTFELKTLLSKTDKTSLCSTWSYNSPRNNANYVNSQLKANLTGTSAWGYDNAYNLLINGNPSLKDHIKTVRKNYFYKNGSDWTASTYNDTLFPFTATELNLTGSKVEGSAYKYWETHTDRGKKNVKDLTSYYWTASSNTNNDYGIWSIDYDGDIGEQGCYSGTIATTFGFCI